MSSLPNASYLSSSPQVGRRHRHRRSAAISGDFDAVGLGLFSPPPTSGSFNESDTHQSELDRHYNFNNKDDFTNEPEAQEFSFPGKLDDLTTETPPRSIYSPTRGGFSPHSLHSPIKLNHKRSFSNSNTPKSKLFLTEPTTVNNDNIPDAIIDLDEILNMNLHIGAPASFKVNGTNCFHKRTESAPATAPGGEVLASPFIKPHTSPFVSSPLSSNSNVLFQHPIKEQTSEAIEEDEEEADDLDLIVLDNDDMGFPIPNGLQGGLYLNSSANSSSSSVRSNQIKGSVPIEKILSNSSKESYNSNYTTQGTGNASHTPQSKRSGAHAKRYQSFYVQSYKISNALKISSSESINIVKPNPGNGSLSGMKDIRLLGHSSSLPSLKTNSKRLFMHPSALGEKRSNLSERKISNSYKHSTDGQVKEHGRNDLDLEDENVSDANCLCSLQYATSTTKSYMSTSSALSNKMVSSNIQLQPQKKQNHDAPQFIKNVSSSPVSMNSDNSSTIISTNDTLQSTDHSSLMSHNEPQQGMKQEATVPIIDRNENVTPSIVINADCDGSSSPSTNSTFKQDDDEKVELKNSFVEMTSDLNGGKSSQSSEFSYSGKSPRKPSPSEQKILKTFQIPAFKSASASNKIVNSSSGETKSNVITSSRSGSVNSLLGDNGHLNYEDEVSSISSRRKENKILNWFKRKQ